MSIIESYKPGINFWDIWGQFLAVNPFKSMYDSDTSEGKKHSSDMMWFIVFCYDIRSIYFNLDFKERIEIIGEDYCGNKEYYADYKDVIEPAQIMYCKMVDTAGERSLRNWRNKLEERDTFISDTPYSMDYYDDRGKIKKGTADQLDAMLGRTTKLWDDYERIQETLVKEGSSSEGRGGAMPSASDEGDM